MKTVKIIAWFIIRDIVRSRWSILNLLFFAAVTTGLFYLQADGGKVAVSLSSLCLVFVPLISLLYTAMYYYSSREFVELILTQPVSRWSVYLALLLGILCSLIISSALGIAVPFLIFGTPSSAALGARLVVLALGSALCAIFSAAALLIGIRFDDRGKGLAAVLGVWLVASIIYDGLVLAAATAFAAYPLETPLLVASILNPIDISRVLFLVQSEMAALMGYTGSVFMRFFDQSTGLLVAVASLLMWFLVPTALGLRRFAKKDF